MGPSPPTSESLPAAAPVHGMYPLTSHGLRTLWPPPALAAVMPSSMFSPNASGLIRTGHVVAAGQTNTVTQDACGFSLPGGSSTNLSPNGVTLAVVAVSATGTACTWSASSDAGWINNLNPTAGTGSGSITYNADTNTGGSTRTGHITAAGLTFTVTQDACGFSFPGRGHHEYSAE